MKAVSIKRKASAAVCALSSLALAMSGVVAVPANAVAEEDGAEVYIDPQMPYVEDEMLVTFESDVTETAAERALSTMGVVEDADEAADDITEEGIEDGVPVVVTIEEGVELEDAMEQVAEDPRVAAVQPNYIYSLIDDETAYETAMVPDDPAAQNTNPRKAVNAWQLDSINAFEAWDIARCEGAVTVAVLDTGCRLDHEDLKNQVLTEYAYDAYNETALKGDTQGHGTHVAGCIAAEANNGLGTAGSSYNAKILPIGVFDDTGSVCYTSTMVSAYEYLFDVIEEHPEINLHVINMSVGGYGSTDATDRALQQCIAKANGMNIITVCAGGNGDSKGNPITSNIWPGDFEECVSVTALSRDGSTPTSWCDYNTAKDICAPGEMIYNTYWSSSASYIYMSGTSMASPITAGAFALLWAYDPDLTVAEAKAVVYETAGELDVPEGREGLYGAGTLDIVAALEALGAARASASTYAVSYGETAAFVCSTANVVNPTYQWQYSKNGTKWINSTLASATEATLRYKLTEEQRLSVQVRCDRRSRRHPNDEPCRL